MIRAMYRSSDGKVTAEFPPADIAGALAQPKGLLWVDMISDTPDEKPYEDLLKDQFNFHPLAIDDALRETHVAKVDDWKDYLYLVLHAVEFDAAAERLRARELDVFLGKNYLVTHHEGPIAAVDRVWANCLKEPRHLSRGADHLLYQLIDWMVADYMPTVDALDDAIDEIEADAFPRPTPDVLVRIFRLKRALLHLRRAIGPEREVLNRLARDDYAVIDARDRVYFRDIYDHLVRMVDINESLREQAAGALDTYLSATANRTNEIMKVLTMVNVLFLPISFLAGFFGMNFFGPSIEVTASPVGRILLGGVAALMAATPAAMYVWMRRRRWV